MGRVAIIWSPRADRQRTEILRERLRSGGADAAGKLAERIHAAIRTLYEYPRAGAMIPQYQDDSLRRIVVEPFLILYRLRDERIGIFMMIDGRREIVQNLPRRPWDFRR